MPRYRIFLADGTELDDFVTNAGRWLPGDVLTITPQERYQVSAIVPPDVLDDFDDEYAGFLEVERLR